MRLLRILTLALCAMLSVTVVPAKLDAATLRIVIKSHPDMGGTCIDVPHGQTVEGMRLQMWDCNHGTKSHQIWTLIERPR